MMAACLSTASSSLPYRQAMAVWNVVMRAASRMAEGRNRVTAVSLRLADACKSSSSASSAGSSGRGPDALGSGSSMTSVVPVGTVWFVDAGFAASEVAGGVPPG